MIKRNKFGMFIYAVAYALIIITMLYAKSYIGAPKIVRGHLFDNFIGFKRELIDLNKEISLILTTEDVKYNEYKAYINRDKVRSFAMGTREASELDGDKEYYDFGFIYMSCPNNIREILKDSSIDENEKVYLKTLYEFNQKLIKKHDKLINYVNKGNVKEDKLEKKIIPIYVEYAEYGEELSNNPEYKILTDYQYELEKEVLTKEQLNEIKKLCEDKFSLFMPNKSLIKYDSKYGRNGEYIFKTDIIKSHSDNVHIEKGFKVIYDKDMRKIEIRNSSWSYSDSTPRLSKESLNKKASELIKKYNKDAYLYEIKESHGLYSYYYIDKKEEIFDEGQKYIIEIEEHGIIVGITMYNRETIDIKAPLNKEIILSKIKDGEVIDCLLVLAPNNSLHYVVHTKYMEDTYEIIYDAHRGNMIDYRNYIEKFYGKKYI